MVASTLASASGSLQRHGFAVGRARAGVGSFSRLCAGHIPFQAGEINFEIVAGANRGDTARERFEIGTDRLQICVLVQNAVGLQLAGEPVLELVIRSELFDGGWAAMKEFNGIVASWVVPARRG